MSYRLTFVQHPTYLHAVVTGVNNKQNVARYLAEVRRECTSKNCSRVLIEERLKGPRLGTLDVFLVAAAESDLAQGNFEAIAFVDVYAKGDLMKFAETVAVNRSIPARVFATVDKAREWLVGKSQSGG
jgi:hypothetical protein